jgi:hypothetical protein
MRSNGMTRWMAALFVTLFYLSSGHASLDKKGHPAENKPIPIKSLLPSAASAKNDEFRITEKTEVLLDGRPCPYSKIPDGATIVLLETDTNLSKEITRIHFRSPRRPAASTSK